MKLAAASQTMSEMDVIIRDLKTHPGFASYIIINNDGIVIKYENVEYKRAVQVAHLVLDVFGKARHTVHHLLGAPEGEMESLQLKSKEYELIVGQSGNYTLVVVQQQATLPMPAPSAMGGTANKKGEHTHQSRLAVAK